MYLCMYIKISLWPINWLLTFVNRIAVDPRSTPGHNEFRHCKNRDQELWTELL